MATPRPPFVQKLAQKIKATLFDKQSYIAIHWRYDKRDFAGHCRERRSRVRRRLLYNDVCTVFNQVYYKPRVFAERLYQEVKGLGLRVIYLAAPPEETSFVAHVKEYLEDNYHIKVFTGFELEQLYSTMFTHCKFVQLNYLDVFSMLEQELCFQSNVFYRSLKSTWSYNIYAERLANGINETTTVIDIITKHQHLPITYR